MEKILVYKKQENGELVEQQVRFKSTASLPVIYAEQFGRELFPDLDSIITSWHPGDKEKNTRGYFDDRANMSLVYKIVWALAKCADRTILPPIEWLDTFEDGLPIWEWFAELSDLMFASFTGATKTAPAAGSK